MRGNQNATACHGCLYIISEQCIHEECEVEMADLNLLRYLVVVESPDHSATKSAHYYLRGEIRYLRNLRRKERLEKEVDVDLAALDKRLRNVLLGDYLSAISHATMSFEGVTARCRVVDRVQETLRRCPWEHPETVFSFFLESPSAEPSEFERMKRNMRAVFEIEGERIMHCIPSADRQKLRDTSLSDVYAAFEERNSDGILRGYLGQWFCKDTVDGIMKESLWRSRPWATGSEDRVAHHLRKFWKDRTKRKEKLDRALQHRSVDLAEGSDLYRTYIHGESEYSVKEVVAVADLENALLAEWDIELGSSKGMVALDVMFENLNVLKVGHFLSVRRGVEAGAVFPISDEEADEDDDEEYDMDDDEYY